MADPAATGSGVLLLGVAVSLGGAVFGPLELIVVFAVGGALIGIGLRGPIPTMRGVLHVVAGIFNALVAVGVAVWALERYTGLAASNWIVLCAFAFGFLGDQYFKALGLAGAVWRRFREGKAAP